MNVTFAEFEISDFGTLMLILDTRESDSGDYSCAAGHAAILSDPVRVIIKGYSHDCQTLF